jgi:hypothetical protein
MNKFKYLLSPENIYLVVFDESAGVPSGLEILGSDIISILQEKCLINNSTLDLEDHGQED